MLEAFLTWLIELGFWKIVGLLFALLPVVLLLIFLVVAIKAKSGFKLSLFNSKDDTDRIKSSDDTNTIFDRRQEYMRQLKKIDTILDGLSKTMNEIETVLKNTQASVSSVLVHSQENTTIRRMSEVQLNQIQNTISVKTEEIVSRLNRLETLFEVYKEFIRENENVLKDVARSNEQLVKVIVDAFDRRK